MVEDYCIKYHIGRVRTIGMDEKGRKKTRCLETYLTSAAGELTPETWRERTMGAIREGGEEELLEKLKEHCRKLPWLKQEKEIENYAMNVLAGRAYRHWPDFEDETEIIWM